MTSIKLGLVQMPGSPSKQENIALAEAGIRACVSQGAQVVCLQELVNTLYFCQREEYEHFELAEASDGPTVKHFEALAQELRAVIVVPFFERRASGVYHNSAAVIDADGTNLGLYRKMHIPDDPGFMEKFYFAPGDLGFRTFKTQYGRLGVLICWTSGIPRRHDSPHSAVLIFCSTPLQSGGIPKTQKNAAVMRSLGKPACGLMRSPMEYTSPP